MKAAVLKELNGPPVFDDFEDPVAGEGQAVVEIAAAAIHHVDLARASGTFYLGPPPLPSVLGVDGVGRLADGRRVFVDAAVAPFGTWAQRALVRTDSLLDVADGVEDATAAALANTGLTAWLALAWRAPVQPGQTVLVLGAAGAVGSVAVQAARLLGAGRVVAAIREGERPPPGADAVVTLTPGQDWAVGFRDASGGGGADLIIDPVWGEPALAALKAAAPGARLVQIGNMAGETRAARRADPAGEQGRRAGPCGVPCAGRGASGGLPAPDAACRARRHHGVPGSDAARRRGERLGKATRRRRHQARPRAIAGWSTERTSRTDLLPTLAAKVRSLSGSRPKRAARPSTCPGVKSWMAVRRPRFAA